MKALVVIGFSLFGIFLVIVIFDHIIIKSQRYRNKIDHFFSSEITNNTAIAYFLFSAVLLGIGCSYFIREPEFTLYMGFPIHSYTNGFVWLFLGLSLFLKVFKK